MSVARSCAQCRRSKVKCDRVRPSCSRCRRLSLRCNGYGNNDRFVSENEVARRNSQRARGELTLESQAVRLGQHEVIDGEIDVIDLEWLNQTARSDIPEPLKRDKEARAVDRFFVNWILHPGRDGISPGHLVHLPVLYYQSDSDCVIWHAVRAMAFADVKNDRTAEGVPFHIKARNSYGTALTRTRYAVQQENKLSDDRTLAALLLIDSFETMYLAQPEPLGPHIAAIRYILSMRGNEQLYDRSRFALFRAANCRLQSRQMMLGENPEPIQEELLRKLDAQRPEVHVALDIMQMSRLCAESKRLLPDSACESAVLQTEKAHEVSRLIVRIEELLNAATAWTSKTTSIWQPKVVDSTPTKKSFEATCQLDSPMANFECPSLFTYSHIWFAYIWNFHAASQIVLRENLLRLILYFNQLQNQETDRARIAQEENAIEKLSSTIIRSFPPLMGLTDQDGKRAISAPQGLMAGRFLAQFAVDVVARSEYTSTEHKNTALKVEEWLRESHALI